MGEGPAPRGQECPGGRQVRSTPKEGDAEGDRKSSFRQKGWESF